MIDVELKPTCCLMMSMKLRKVFPKTPARRLFVVFVGMILWVIVVLPIFYLFNKEAYSNSSNITLGDKTIEDRLDLHASILRIDLAERITDIHIQIDPRGRYRNANHSLTEQMTAYFRVHSFTLPDNRPVNAVTLQVPFLQGNVRDYPFGKYSAHFPFLIENKNSDPVPVYATFTASIPTLTISFGPMSESDMGEQEDFLTEASFVSVKVRRTSTVIMFCFFLTCVMWALALSIGALTYDVLIFKRDCPAPILSIGIAMLFALPTIRNSQPGIPSFGCAADVLGFFW
ncbi:hypothetical protein DSO57_1026808 [Entomophthora muscae]|uniref:Uncharacterized protein n=1 Tax=Entomophthora muscae TaxID=34485 RepID=A0ACC2UBW0_9FUNG|nr:hypothetical protein DSO57_1026808 [Entomophthora muscae]